MTARRAAALLASGPATAVVAACGAVAIALLAVKLPDAAVGLALTPLVVTGLTLLLGRRVGRHPDVASLRSVFWVGIVLRLFAVAAQLAVGYLIYRGQIDFVGYWHQAQELIGGVIGEGRLDLLYDSSSIEQYFVSRSSLVVSLLVALTILIVGPNIVAIFLVGVPVSAAGAYFFYRAYEALAPDAASRRRYGMTIFLFPSLVFWSVFLGKDVWVFFFMGCAAFALSCVLQSPRPGRLLQLGVSLLMVGILRPHIGATVGLAALAAIVSRPLPLRGPALYLRPVSHIVMAVVLSYGFTVVAASAVSAVGGSALTVDALAERAFLAHTGFATTAGGGALPAAIETKDPTDVALFIPYGVMTLLFRPFVWEAHNAVALVSGLENAVLLMLVLWRVPSLWQGVRMARRHPMAVFAIVAFLMTSTVLAFDWNLGAMQRHRTMVLPFLFMLMALPRRSVAARTEARS